MDSIEKLINFYNKSNDEDMYHVIAGNVLHNIHKIEDSTIYDLADICFSSPSTISRLMKKMEFENYTDFKSEIHHALKNYRYLNRNIDSVTNVPGQLVSSYINRVSKSLEEIPRNLNESDLEAISFLLNESEKVFFFATAEIYVRVLQKELIISGKKSYFSESYQAQLLSLNKIKPGSLIFAVVPNILEVSSIRSILKKGKEQGAKIVTICSEKTNDYKKYSDIQISFDGSKTSLDLYAFTAIVNLIKFDYSERYVNEIIENTYG